jgi:hypothetical protein
VSLDLIQTITSLRPLHVTRHFLAVLVHPARIAMYQDMKHLADSRASKAARAAHDYFRDLNRCFEGRPNAHLTTNQFQFSDISFASRNLARNRN